MSMEEDKPPINVSHDSSVQSILSDLSGTPTCSPKGSRAQEVARTNSVDAKLKRKWKRRVEKERAYERAKAEKSKEQSSDADNSSSFIELTQDLLVPCVDDAVCSEKSPELEFSKEPTNLADLSDSLVDPVEPILVTPDEKESHKVRAALNTSGEKYSPKDVEYYKFHEQLYAPPQDEEYVSFLKGLENENGDPSAEDFDKWLQGMDTDLQPIAPLSSPDTPENMKSPAKRVAFSKETTVRFFSRTREELLELKRKYKKTIGRGDSLNEEDGCDDEEWPVFKYLDDKLKEMEESSAWDDPMSAVTDMFVSKEVKEKISPLICVCENPVEESVQQSNNPSRSLADLDEDEELGPAVELATARAAASLNITEERKEQSFLSHESSGNASSIAALWFAESFKKTHDETPERGDSFVRPAPSPSSSKSSSPDKHSASSSRITIESPKSLTVIKEAGRPRSEGSMEKEQDPSDPVKESLSWLADDLDDSQDEGGRSVLSADPLNDSHLSLDKSLGRHTNSNLLRKVSEHLNVSSISGGTTNTSSVDQEDSGELPKDKSFLSTSSSSTRDLKTATALKKLLEPPDNVLQETNAKESDTQTITVSVAELDVLVRSVNEKNTMTQRSSDLKDVAESDLVSSRSSEGSDSSKETPFDQKRHVVKAAKRWAASQKAGHYSSSSNLSPTGSVEQRKKHIQVVKAAKRWAATQKASTKPIRILSPTPEDGPDLDESRDWDEKAVNTSVEISEATELWDGVKVTPCKEEEISAEWSDPWAAEEGPDLEESNKWDAFALNPNMTTTTGSVSNDDASLEETEEWVAFDTGGVKSDALLNESWSASFPQEETAASAGEEILQTTCADPAKSPRKQVRVSPVKQAVPSTRVQKIAREFERRHGASNMSPTEQEKEKWDVSPLTPSTPWADVDRRKDTAIVEHAYPDLQQPVLDDSLGDSNNSSPVSVTHM